MYNIPISSFNNVINISRLKLGEKYTINSILEEEQNLSLMDEARILYMNHLSELNYKVELVKRNNKLYFKFHRLPNLSNKDLIKEQLIKQRTNTFINHIDSLTYLENKYSNIFATAEEVLNSKFIIGIEECKTKEQIEIYKYCRFYSTLSYKENVGRRVKFLIRDLSYNHKPIIGISSLVSSVVRVMERDEWIGWDNNNIVNEKKINCIMDMGTCISMPPYNELLSGKLICYIMASNEIRNIILQKYKKKNENVCFAAFTTTSLYGSNSSQYNRIRYYNHQLYQKIGVTKGYGKTHVSDELFDLFKKLLNENENYKKYKFNGGTNSSFRIIRQGSQLIGGNNNLLLYHGLQKAIYIVPLASNYKLFLTGKCDALDYFNFPLNDMVDYWRKRWYTMRIKNPLIQERIRSHNEEWMRFSQQITN